MIPLAIPRTDGNERKYLNECIDSNFVSSVGPFVDMFERLVGDSTGCSGAVAVNSGTSALHLALIASGVRPGDLVILPSFTFIASANAIAYCGADPWLLDITESSWTLDPAELFAALETGTEMRGGERVHRQSGRRVSCVMPVYTLGCPAEMDQINEICARFGIPVAVDAAAAIGARYEGKNLSELAPLSALSFNGNKTVTAGGGGAVIGHQAESLGHIRHLSTTARRGPEYLHDEVGYNYRLTNVQAAVGCAQIERLDEFVQIKRKIRDRYAKAFELLEPRAFPFPEPDWATSACWFSGLYLPDWQSAAVKDLLEALSESGIQARPFWMPVHLQPPFKGAPRRKTTICDRIWSRVVVLPCATGLSDSDQQYVVDTVIQHVSANAHGTRV
jgi:dTDP-4-amino-4,6-dideoxygalactose transaminase